MLLGWNAASWVHDPEHHPIGAVNCTQIQGVLVTNAVGRVINDEQTVSASLQQPEPRAQAAL